MLNKLGSRFPITSRLVPNSWGNMLYLAESAVLTRMGVVAARIYENKPSRNKNPNYDRIDKYKSFFERINVELFGTIGFLLSLHLGMDISAWFFEGDKRPFNQRLKSITDEVKKLNLSKSDEKIFIKTLKKMYGHEAKNRIAHILFNIPSVNKLTARLEEAGLQRTRMEGRTPKSLIPPKLMDQIKAFDRKLKLTAAIPLLVGITAGSLVGGLVIQMFNDRVFAPKIIPLLNKWMGIKSDKPPSPFYYPRKGILQTNPTTRPGVVFVPNAPATDRTFRF